ncbi:PPC domain-containing DNA-binding protein [Piscinibacter sp.]|uniref:PPC domain-containing DNA-binding protein n=1 Tax=Piscinibacter sp. TaxID=1903157 RepID=UPI0039E6E45D
MLLLPLRLNPGDDLRAALLAALRAQGHEAAFVLSGIGSLAPACLRLAGASEALRIEADTEILSLAGTLGAGGAHLHASLSDAAGRVVGGHVLEGCRVRTTAEVLLAVLPGQRFERLHDPATGCAELIIRTRQDPT